MTASDLTPAQLAAAEKFLLDIAKASVKGRVYLDFAELVQVVALYGEMCRKPGEIVVYRKSTLDSQGIVIQSEKENK